MTTTFTTDPDPQETREWLEALRGVIATEGPERARELIAHLVDEARRNGAHISLGLQTPYVNTIPAEQQAAMPGDRETRGAAAPLHALERARHGGARQQRQLGARRPRRQLRIGRDAVRRRLQSFLPRADRSRSAATSSSFRGTRRRASTRARSSKVASPRSSSNTFVKRSTARAFRRIRTRG